MDQISGSGGPIHGGDPHSAEGSEAELRDALAPADEGIVQRILRNARSRGLTFRDFHDDFFDRVLFMGFAVTGILLVIFTKLLGLSGWPSELCAISLLIGYASLSWTSPRLKLHPERLGDNCYYMGFLFTLTSLSAALVALQGGDESTRGTLLESLLGSFGVALFSTIAGIALRVFFMQMHREIEDVEEQLRLELQAAAAHLKDQMSDAVGRLESFRIRTGQVIEEQSIKSMEEFTSTSNKLAAKLAEAGDAHAVASEILAKGTEEASAAISSAVTTIVQQMKTSVGTHQETTLQLSRSAEKLVSEVARLVARVDNIEVPSDLLTRQVEDARLRMESLVEAFERMASADRDRQVALGEAGTRLDGLLKQLGNLAPFDNIAGSAGRLAETIELSLIHI